MGIIIAILVFGFIVFFHELGHFLVAKWNHIVVTDFSIGMGPAILKKQIGETRYCLRILPIGGMCMMGEDDPMEEEDDPDKPAEGEDDSAEGADQKAPVSQNGQKPSIKGNFNEKSVWARMAVIFAGPFFNFILAIILAVIIVGWVGYDKPVVGSTMEGYPAQEAGLQEGDQILSMNGKTIHLWKEITLYNTLHPGARVEVEYERDGEKETVTVTPQKYKDEEGNTSYLLGISPEAAYYTKANPLTAVQYGVYEVKYWISSTLESLKMLATGQVSVKQLSGPIGITSMMNDTYQESKSYGIEAIVINMLNFALLLTANLGIMNLIPLPALDGGRLFFLIIEAIRRKRIPPEKEGMVHLAGMALLLVLMVFVMYNDIMKELVK